MPYDEDTAEVDDTTTVLYDEPNWDKLADELNKEAFRLAWDKADKEEHKELLTLPNWNNEIFREISGIDAEMEIEKEAN